MIRLGVLSFILLLLSFATSAHPSWGIVVDNHGNIYFADILHNGLGSVWKFTRDGDLELLLADFHAHNVNLDSSGRLIVANGENHHTMIRLMESGQYDTLVSTRDFTKFNGGNCTYSPDNAVVFGMGNYLWKLGVSGQMSRLSNFKFGWNQTVYAATDGSYFAPDIGDGKGRLIHIDAKGNSRVLATDIMQLGGREYDRSSDVLLGIGQNEEGDVFIADTAGKRIVKITPNGITATYYQPKDGWLPTGITFRDGQAFILEFNGNTSKHGPRITRISPTGKTEVIFDYRNFDI